MAKAKPFVKWVGGKGQLIEQLEALLPADFDKRENLTYIEPFVGGGAMLFHILQYHPNISSAVINDINKELIICYNIVKNNPSELVNNLSLIQKEYFSLSSEDVKKSFFLKMRDKFNNGGLTNVECASLFIFLNRTCFNGLYRVNKSGKFNVPFGKYEKPTICDTSTIYADSELLKHVTILNGDFEETLRYASNNSFFYFDPPYRPLSKTSSFNDYSKEAFNDDSQIRLKLFCDKINDIGHFFMLSNSDCSAKDKKDTFFDELYSLYNINRVFACRNINAIASKRGKLTELLIRNYTNLSYSSTDLSIVAEPQNEYRK